MPKKRSHGDGALWERPDGTWMGRFEKGRDHNGKRIRWEGTGKTRSAVRKKMDKAREDQAQTGSTSNANMTLQAWLDTWLEQVKRPSLKPMTYSDYAATARIHITPALGRHKLSALTVTSVREWYAKLVKTTSPGNARKAHAILRSALGDAEREGLIPRNVARLVKVTTNSKSRGALTSAEAREVLDVARNTDLYSRWAMALLTGARQGECLGLTWDRVDLEAKTIDISWQLQRLPKSHGCGETCGRSPAKCPKWLLKLPNGFEARALEGTPFHLTRPKSVAGTRVVPIPPDLLTALQDHGFATITDEKPHGLVWTDEGEPIDRRRDNTAWHELLTKAKVPDVPLHSARHTTATLLMDEGIDVAVIQSILGHSQATTTRMYQHADLTMARAALDALSASLN